MGSEMCIRDRWKAILSGSLTVILMGLAQGLFGLKRKNKKSKVSAYPWS